MVHAMPLSESAAVLVIFDYVLEKRRVIRDLRRVVRIRSLDDH